MMLLATAAWAEMPPPSDSAARFDVIHNVPEVQSIAIDAATGSLYAAVSPFSGADAATSEIVRWSLDPIRLAGTWPSGILVSDLGISPAGLVYAAGQTVPAAGTKGSAAQRIGRVVSFDPDNAADQIEPVVESRGSRFAARFNQAAFDGKGWVYAATPTAFSILVFPEGDWELEGPTTMPPFVLECGPPAQLSVFRSGERVAYAASTTDGALLETGFVDNAPEASEKAPANCFRVTNVFGYKEAPPTLNSVVHAVLADASGNPDAVVALEPNTGILHLLRLDPGTQQLTRAGWIDLSQAAGEAGGAVGPGTFNLLAASQDGSVIFVGGQGRGEILRFRRDGDDLLPVGTLRTGDGLKSIEIGADGGFAAVVMRDREGLNRIHVIQAPASLGEGWRGLPAGGNTLRQVQSELNRLGFDVGPADGILGPRTISAIDQLRQGKDIAESEKNKVNSMVNGVLLTRLPQERSY